MRETIGSADASLACLFGRRTEAAHTIPPAGGPLPTWAPRASPATSAPFIYAVYTDYRLPGDDVDGVYTLVISRRIRPGSVPLTVTVTIPNSSRHRRWPMLGGSLPRGGCLGQRT